MSADLSPGLVARARLLHVSTRVPKATIAAALGVSEARYRAISRAWPRAGRPARGPRRAPASRAREQAAAPTRSPAAPAAAAGRRARTRRPSCHDRRDVALRMERFVADRISAYEADLAAGRDADPERTARALGHHARTLTVVRDYLNALDKEPPKNEPGRAPRSLAELRDELLRHLERVRDEERARRGL